MFFSELASYLECFPPEFFHQPFTHMHRVLGNFVRYLIPGSPKVFLSAIHGRSLLEKAIKEIEVDSEEWEKSITSHYPVLKMKFDTRSEHSDLDKAKNSKIEYASEKAKYLFCLP